MGGFFQQLEQALGSSLAAPGQVAQGTVVRLVSKAQENQDQLAAHITQQVVAPLVYHGLQAGLAELAHLTGVPGATPTPPGLVVKGGPGQ